MFKKVLIAEDQDVINNGVKTSLSGLKIKSIDHSQYCDEALLKLKRAKLENNSFDLLICDLSFAKDHHEQKIQSGEELIEVIRKDFPDLKIIVFSIEDRVFTIQKLQKTHHVNGYVLKSREGARELKKAIQHSFVSDTFYISPELKGALTSQNVVEISELDIFIIDCLSKGLLQEGISQLLKEKGLNPSSVSAIEKRLKLLKENFNANNPAHLVSLAKDLGLI
jgi:DNA-binding NarL/FixJ family response regulator